MGVRCRQFCRSRYRLAGGGLVPPVSDRRLVSGPPGGSVGRVLRAVGGLGRGAIV